MPSFCSFDLKTFELLMKAAGSYAIILLDKYQYGGCFSALKLFSHRSAIGLLLYFLIFLNGKMKSKKRTSSRKFKLTPMCEKHGDMEA